MIRRTFRTIHKFLVPSWLSAGEGELVSYSLDVVKDAFVERLRLGLMARFPQNGPNGETAPEDALSAMGGDRKIERGRNETARDYAARLIPWLDDHAAKGSGFMMLKQLAGYCGPGFSFRIYQNNGVCFSRDVDGVETYTPNTTWDWDGRPQKWSRFWVVIYPPDGVWEWPLTATYGDPSTPDFGRNAGQWGVVMTRGEQGETATLRRIIRDWKPAGMRCVNIVIAYDPASFDPAAPEPDGTWGSWGKVVGGERVASRLATARYLRGTGKA